LELLVVFLAALLLLHSYGQIKKQHMMVTVATLVAWYFSMIIVFILPLDVSSTFYRECIEKEKIDHQTNTSKNSSDLKRVESVTNATTVNTTSTIVPSTLSSTTHFQHETTPADFASSCLKPWSYVPENTLPTMWILVYWTSQFLTWLVLPFIQSYVCAGDFTIPGKMKRAVVENGIYYASYLVLFCCLLIYIIASPNIHFDISQLKILIITCSNTWGLFLLILLLGYGLVEVPRNWWRCSHVAMETNRNYFKLSKLSTEKQEATENYEDLLEEIKQISSCVNYSHPYRKFINIIISKCPDDFQQSLLDNNSDDVTNMTSQSRRNSDVIERSVPSEAGFVKLHKQLLQSSDTLRRTTVQYKICMDKCLQLENIQRNINNQADRVWKADSSLLASNSDIKEPFIIRKFFSLKMKWKFYCEIQPMFRRIFSIMLMVLTVLVIWSECTFFNEHPVLSLFAIFINLAKSNYHYFYIELASIVVIFYLCYCAYFTVFRMKIFNYYYIANHHQTNESSLIFVGMMLCRLTPPLCLNFLGLIHLDTGIEITDKIRVETAYTQIMGHLELIPFISEGFNVYFPILVLLLCVCTYFEVGSRMLKFIGFQKLISTEVDDIMIDLINDGKQLVARERRRVDRRLKQEDRSKQLDKLTNNSNHQWKGRYMKKHTSHIQDQPYQNDDATTSSNVTSYKSITIDQYVSSDDDVISNNTSSSTNPRNLFDDI